MRTAKLVRSKDDGTQTIGRLYCYDSDSATTFDTLELAWKGNQHDISCIPVTTNDSPYTVKWTYSPRHGKFTYEITNVPDRTGIRFDVANFAKQLLGCCALGIGYGDINSDGEIDILNSKKANDRFNAFFGEKDFQLTVMDELPSA